MHLLVLENIQQCILSQRYQMFFGFVVGRNDASRTRLLLRFFQAVYQTFQILVAVKLNFDFSFFPILFDQNFGAEVAG